MHNKITLFPIFFSLGPIDKSWINQTIKLVSWLSGYSFFQSLFSWRNNQFSLNRSPSRSSLILHINLFSKHTYDDFSLQNKWLEYCVNGEIFGLHDKWQTFQIEFVYNKVLCKSWFTAATHAMSCTSKKENIFTLGQWRDWWIRLKYDIYNQFFGNYMKKGVIVQHNIFFAFLQSFFSMLSRVTVTSLGFLHHCSPLTVLLHATNVY